MQTVVVVLCMLVAVAVVDCQLKCAPLPTRPVPTNVNNLHPNDIKVVMSLGDSITAGFGMMGKIGGLDEFRGQSWSIGGDKNATTVFNFLKTWNPALIGGSLGHHIVEICIDPHCYNYQYRPSEDVFNAAQSGAQVDDLGEHELDYLLQQLAANSEVDMQNDWKLLTLFIGANDLCGTCSNASDPSGEAARFKTGVTAVLEKVRTNIPRVFVNLVQMFNLSGVYKLSLQSPYCTDVHKDFSSECPCIFDTNGNITRPITDAVTQQVNVAMEEIEQYYQSQNYTEFAVVVQPFGRNADIASLPIDFISTLDCFHPSLLAHQGLATALWNNMITPSASKKTTLDITDSPNCPTADTLLYTY